MELYPDDLLLLATVFQRLLGYDYNAALLGGGFLGFGLTRPGFTRQELAYFMAILGHWIYGM